MCGPRATAVSIASRVHVGPHSTGTPSDHCSSVASNGWNASTLRDPSIFVAYLVLTYGGICRVGLALLVEWNSGSSGIIRARGRNSTGLVVGRTDGPEMFACLPFSLSAIRVNGAQSWVTSAVTGPMPLGHRCAELVGGLVVVRWRVSAFWSPGAAGMKQTRRRLAAASQPATGITAGSCPAVPVRAISSARSYTCTPSAELAVVLRPKIVVPFCWHWRFASTLCAEW